jgi:protocatechuate 3,4-dioxygenase alpha subunit
MTGLTPSQTVGPYFRYGLTPNGEYPWNNVFSNDLLTADVSGERIRIEGRVFDGDGVAMTDSMLEIWQADASGRFNSRQADGALSNSGFKGFGRCATDSEGGFSFLTIKPGMVMDPDNHSQAPHILLAVYARGMTRQAQTRIYFPDEAANASDPILMLVPEDRRETLIANRFRNDQGLVYRFDVHLQGERETVFFDV